MSAQMKRRDLMLSGLAAAAFGSAIVIGGVTVAADAKGVGMMPTPFALAAAKYQAATARFNQLPHDLEIDDYAEYEREVALLAAAADAVDNAPAADLREFALSFLATHDDGQTDPLPAIIERLVDDAKRLTGAA